MPTANPNAPPPIYGGVNANAPYGAAAPYGAGGIGAHASPRVMAAGLDPVRAAAAAGQSPPPPEGFSRPPNRAHPYTQFEMFKIGDLDEVMEAMPRMPAVLVPHDVYHDDWIRLMTVRRPVPPSPL